MADVRSLRLRWPTLAVVFALAAITLGSSYTVHRVNRSQERRVLHERASEIALILTDSFASLQTQIATISAETALNGSDTHAFLGAASALSTAGGGFAEPAALARLDPTSGLVTFLARIGGLPARPSADAAALIRRSRSASTQKVNSSVFAVGGSRVLGLAYPVGASHLVIYEQLPLNINAAGSAATNSAPFREVSVALYAAPTRDANALLLTANGSVPRSGEIATAAAPFGADTWLVAIHAKSPFTGKFAANVYLLVLLGGILITVVFGFLVELLLRRRDYALALVAERTEELQESLHELELAQEKLVQATRLAAIGQLASAIGHELRNPLGVITNAHYLLGTALQRPDGGPDAARHLRTAEREVGAATLIVSDLLDYARAREPVATSVDIPDLIDEVQTVIPAPEDVTVDRRDTTDVPLARADRDQLRQVLLNLVSNAYEAMPEGGTVTISTTAVADGVRISVADTGTGMDEETREQLFEPFFTRKTKGIGLGLSVTKRIVETHRGTIAVDSELGLGTTFTIELPAASEEGAQV